MSVEKSVEQMRAEISKRLQEAAQLRQRAGALMTGGAIDEGINLSSRADATECALRVLRDKLEQLLPGLIDERLRAALPEIEARLDKREQDLENEQEKAEQAFVQFFKSWNHVLETDLGRRVAEQLFGDFGTRIHSAASDSLYVLALTQRREAEARRFGWGIDKECAALREQVRKEVAGLATVEAAVTEGVKT